jgi:putative DNA primase/helicase
MTPLDMARAYCARGWRPLPIPRGQKVPTLQEWQKLRLGDEDLAGHFNGQPMNIGVLNGEPSGGLVDVDLDAPEARLLADAFLPPTGCRFGRRSAPRSHWLYVTAPLAETEKFADVEKHDDDERAVLVELRSTGTQTVAPGSVHPSGEAVEWAEDGEAASIEGPALRGAVVRLAIAALLARHWPSEGTRHQAALAAAGVLLRAGVDEAAAVTIVVSAPRPAGDPEWRDRKRAALDTAAALATGEPVTAGPTLAELLRGEGEKVVARLRKWLGVDGRRGGFPLTDTGNAERFTAQHRAIVRYCYAWRTWLLWTGTHWRRDPGDGAMRLAKATVRGIMAEAAAEPNPEERKRLATWAIKSESEPALRRLLILAQSEPGMAVTPAELDREAFLLNTPSGTLELRTGHLRPHNPGDLITKVTAAPYQAEARHPVLDAFFERVLPDEETRAFVQRVAGYCLTGSTAEEKVFFGHGPTAGGKSTLLKALRTALGDYATVADFATFCEREQGGPREDIARLAGVRLVVSVEVKDGTRLAEGLVKWLSGGDVIAARRLYEQTFEFVPAFKLFLASNYRPRARDDDEALWRRILEIPFTESIPEAERDPEVKRILCDPAIGGPAVLAWAAEGATAWFTEGLGTPGAVKAATADYRDSMDPLREFFADRCVFEEIAAVTAGELRAAYDGWAKEQGVRYPLNANAFGERLRARGCASKAGRGGRRWLGVRLRGPLDDVEQGPERPGTPGTSIPNTSLYARAQEKSLGNGRSSRSAVPPAREPGEDDPALFGASA